MPTPPKKRSVKAGLPPGSLVHIGKRLPRDVRIQIFNYNAGHTEEKAISNLVECFAKRDPASVTWINVDGLEVETVEKLGNHFGVHPLILEDILNTDQRPKLEDFESMIFIVLKMIYFNDSSDELVVEQVSLVLGNNFVLSFQEEAQRDVFTPVRLRLKNPQSRLRTLGADSLVHALIDAVVDHYFFVLERMGERIENLEDAILRKPIPECVSKLHRLKREALFLRKAVWPLREVADELFRTENPLIRKPTQIFFRDVYDHAVQVIDMVEIFREMLSGMLDVYLSTISNRTNNIMKVLTLFTAVFIPLTFIAGVYGMNFEYMPELHWKWGYPAVWGVMAAIASGTLYFFKRKRWL